MVMIRIKDLKNKDEQHPMKLLWTHAIIVFFYGTNYHHRASIGSSVDSQMVIMNCRYCLSQISLSSGDDIQIGFLENVDRGSRSSILDP